MKRGKGLVPPLDRIEGLKIVDSLQLLIQCGSYRFHNANTASNSYFLFLVFVTKLSDDRALSISPAFIPMQPPIIVLAPCEQNAQGLGLRAVRTLGAIASSGSISVSEWLESFISTLGDIRLKGMQKDGKIGWEIEQPLNSVVALMVNLFD